MDNILPLSPILEGLLKTTNAGDVTELFLELLAVIFVTGAVLGLLGWAKRFVDHAPTMLTSVGILGTFVGIVIGLMHFDPQNIDGSIAMLLDGLKTAFITSLAGMGAAILFKVLSTTPLMPLWQRKQDVRGAGPDEILNALLEQNKHFDALRTAVAGDEETSLVGQMKLMRGDQNDQHKATLNAVADFRKAISGDEETSLIGQFKLMRSDAGDHHRAVMQALEQDRAALGELANKLWQELDEFARLMAKGATEQVINALKEVIADFNNNLTEQFGDNFKALDASVQKLVEWQANYRQQLEQMSEQYGQGVQAITLTGESVAQISEESKQIPVTMEALKEVMEVNQHQLKELASHLEAFRDMRDKAVEAVPQIRQQVEETIMEVAASVDVANAHYTKLLDRSDDYIKKHDEQTREYLGRFVQSTNEGIELVRAGLERGAEAANTAIVTGADEFGSKVHSLLETTTGEITASVQKSGEHQRGVLEQADAYTREHDEKTKALLSQMVSSTEEGIDKVREGLESSAEAAKTAIVTGADEFGSKVHSLMETTTGEITASVQKSGEHQRGVLEQADAYAREHDEKTRELLDRMISSTEKGIDKVREGLENGANAAKVAIMTGAKDFDNNVQRLNANLTGTSDHIAAESEQIRSQLEDTFTEVNTHVRTMVATLSDDSKELMTTL